MVIVEKNLENTTKSSNIFGELPLIPLFNFTLTNFTIKILMGKVPLYPYLIKHKHMSSPTRIFKIPKLIDDSSERFDDSVEIRRLRRFPRRDLTIPTTLTSDEIWQRLQAQTNTTISLHERVTKARG